jgi:hypothetical protein
MPPHLASSPGCASGRLPALQVRHGPEQLVTGMGTYVIQPMEVRMTNYRRIIAAAVAVLALLGATAAPAQAATHATNWVQADTVNGI